MSNNTEKNFEGFALSIFIIVFIMIGLPVLVVDPWNWF